MTITERLHAIWLEIETLIGIHPKNTPAVAQATANIGALANHPDVPPETQAVIASVTAKAAAVAPPVPAVTPTAEPAPPTVLAPAAAQAAPPAVDAAPAQPPATPAP